MYENEYQNNMYHYETGSAPSGNVGKAPDKKEKKGMGAGKKIAIALCCGLCFGVFAGVGFEAVSTASSLIKGVAGNAKEAVTETAQIQETLQGTEEASGQSTKDETVKKEDSSAGATDAVTTQTVTTAVTDVTEVVKEVMPSVVSVNNKYVETMSFFGQSYSNEAESRGSGIIVGQNDTELLLVSNYHVVASA